MIRPFTILCMLLAAGSGLYLYHEKYRAAVLDRQIAQVVKATDAARERTGMLRAEWTLLNEPDRLKELATRYLTQLQPMAPSQFVQMSALDARLPAVAQPPVAAPDDDDATPVAGGTPIPPLVPAAPPPMLASAAPAPTLASAAPAPNAPSSAPANPAPVVAGNTAAASPAPPVRMADAEIDAPIRPGKPGPAPAPSHDTPTRRRAVADAGFQTGPAAEPRPLPTRRVMAPIVEAFATARPVRINRPPMVQRTEAVMPVAAPVMTGSVLGGGRPTLAPPVPFGGGGG